MALANYATVDDLAAVLPNTPADKQATWEDNLSDASREVDGYCHRYFFTEGTSTKYLDVPGDAFSGAQTWPQIGARGAKSLFVTGHDFYNVTALKVAQIENGDPNNPNQWITLVGDGVTPPSDFLLEPGNENFVGTDGDAHQKPFYWVQLPTYGPTTSTTFRGYFTAGKRTVSITATWGWPAVPVQIKNITRKIAVRMWRGAPTGYTGQIGGQDGPSATLLRYLDANDFATLDRYRKWIGGFA